jgi:hypothetical protein
MSTPRVLFSDPCRAAPVNIQCQKSIARPPLLIPHHRTCPLRPDYFLGLLFAGPLSGPFSSRLHLLLFRLHQDMAPFSKLLTAMRGAVPRADASQETEHGRIDPVAIALPLCNMPNAAGVNQELHEGGHRPVVPTQLALPDRHLLPSYFEGQFPWYGRPSGAMRALQLAYLETAERSLAHYAQFSPPGQDSRIFSAEAERDFQASDASRPLLLVLTYRVSGNGGRPVIQGCPKPSGASSYKPLFCGVIHTIGRGLAEEREDSRRGASGTVLPRWNAGQLEFIKRAASSEGAIDKMKRALAKFDSSAVHQDEAGRVQDEARQAERVELAKRDRRIVAAGVVKYPFVCEDFGSAANRADVSGQYWHHSLRTPAPGHLQRMAALHPPSWRPCTLGTSPRSSSKPPTKTRRPTFSSWLQKAVARGPCWQEWRSARWTSSTTSGTAPLGKASPISRQAE